MNRKRHRRTRFRFTNNIIKLQAVRTRAIEAKVLHEAQLKTES